MTAEEEADVSVPALTTIAHAARYLNCSRGTVYNLMRTGELESAQVRGSRRVLTASLLEYVQRHRTRQWS